MKTQLLVMLIAIFGYFNVTAQDRGDIEIGGKLGWSTAAISTTTSGRSTFTAGISGEYYFSDRWGIKTKLIYDRKGWSNGFITDNNSTTTTDFRLNYLTIPVMANWHFNSKRRWYLNFGPYVGVLINATDSALKTDVKEAFSSSDFGIALGIGHQFYINENTKFYMEYDIQTGYKNIFTSESDISSTHERTSLDFGLLFKL